MPTDTQRRPARTAAASSWRPTPRQCRQVGRCLAGPLLAGVVLACSVLANGQVSEPAHVAITGLLLAPAVFVHAHRRDEQHDFSYTDLATSCLLAGLFATLTAIVGLSAGAIGVLLIAIGEQTGSLHAVASVCGIVGCTVGLRRRARPSTT